MTIRPFKKLEEEVIYENPYWHTKRSTFELPDGSKKVYEYPAARDAVMMVVVNAQGKIMVQYEYRPFVETVVAEFPAGGIDEGEAPEIAANRELAEECNYQAKDLKKIGEFFPSAGSTNRKAHIFLARNLVEVSGVDGDEFEIEHEWLTVDELERFIAAGKMMDGWAVASWLLAKPHLNK